VPGDSNDELTEVTQTPDGPPPGTILLGKYRVDGVLGVGGYGQVVKAHHLQLDEPVAIKLLKNHVTLDEDGGRRFLREAQAASKLKSEHVARLRDVGTLGGGKPFMVMELLSGLDLNQVLEDQGTISVEIAADVVLQACDALAEAHALGIVHRDLKPSNLFLTKRPDGSRLVKVLDFGISKAPTMDMSLTQTASVLGTPTYMSPEQTRSARTVDARSDIWGLGTVLYELVEGHPPFEAESFAELCVKIAIESPPPLVRGHELAHVIARCLAKDPADRYQTVAELAADLAPFAPQETALTYVDRIHRLLHVPRFATASDPHLPSPSQERTAFRPLRRRWSVIAAGVLVAVLAAVLVFVIMRREPTRYGAVRMLLVLPRMPDPPPPPVRVEPIDVPADIEMPAKLLKKKRPGKNHKVEDAPPAGPGSATVKQPCNPLDVMRNC